MVSNGKKSKGGSSREKPLKKHDFEKELNEAREMVFGGTDEELRDVKQSVVELVDIDGQIRHYIIDQSQAYGLLENNDKDMLTIIEDDFDLVGTKVLVDLAFINALRMFFSVHRVENPEADFNDVDILCWRYMQQAIPLLRPLEEVPSPATKDALLKKLTSEIRALLDN